MHQKTRNIIALAQFSPALLELEGLSACRYGGLLQYFISRCTEAAGFSSVQVQYEYYRTASAGHCRIAL